MIVNSYLHNTGDEALSISLVSEITLANVVIDCDSNPSINGTGTCELAEVVFLNDNHIGAGIIVTQLANTYASNLTVRNNITIPDGQLLLGASSGTDGQIPIAATGNNIAYGSITSVDTSVTITVGPNSIDLSAGGAGGPTQWVPLAADGSLVNNQFSYNTKVALLTMVLPAAAAVGTVLALKGTQVGAGGWIITQNALQNIQVGNVSSTIGVGGSVASTLASDGISLICVVADTTWEMVFMNGNLTIV